MKIILQPEAKTISNLEIAENQQYLLTFFSKVVASLGYKTREVEQIDENS